MKLKDRIIELRRVKASELIPNPRNWRTHPEAQQDAMRGILAEVGIADAMLARETPDGLMLIDGHLRADVAPDNEWPVLVLDVTDEEADKILATHDPLAAMAEADGGKLAELLAELEIESGELQLMMSELAADNRPDVISNAATADEAEPERNTWDISTGDVWAVGRHNLIIGDCQRHEGERFDGVCTDPPYELSGREVAAVMSRMADVAVVLCGDAIAFELPKWWDFRLDMIWEHRTPKKLPNKNVPLIYHAHALVLARHHKIKTGWTKPRSDFGSIIRTEQEYVSAHGHGKSAELFRAMLAGFAWKTVCDPFAGSGASLIACEQDGRTWTGYELFPEKAAICLDRAKAFGLSVVKTDGQKYNTGAPAADTAGHPKHTRSMKETEHV